MIDCFMKAKATEAMAIALCIASMVPSSFGANEGGAPTRLPRSNSERNQRRAQEFTAFDPHYNEAKAERLAKARILGGQVIGREKSGQNTQLSHQILSEIIWLASSTADFARLDQRLADLHTSLACPEHEAEAQEQNPEDGSWGKGYTEWFFKLVGSYGNLDKSSKSRFKLLDRINSPEKLAAYFMTVSVSDIARTGVDHEREFNESMSYLMRMILREKPKGFPYHPELKATLMDLILNRLRNVETGFWGERYVHDDRVELRGQSQHHFSRCQLSGGKRSRYGKSGGHDAGDKRHEFSRGMAPRWEVLGPPEYGCGRAIQAWLASCERRAEKSHYC